MGAQDMSAKTWKEVVARIRGWAMQIRSRESIRAADVYSMVPGSKTARNMKVGSEQLGTTAVVREGSLFLVCPGCGCEVSVDSKRFDRHRCEK